jgi:hypothetical protein
MSKIFTQIKKASFLTLALGSSLFLNAQHNNEFFNDGAEVTIQAGAEVYVMGDVHNVRATGLLDNDGYLEVQGHMYSDNLFQQRGTGTTRMINDDVNMGQTQFISGSYAVRGGQAAIGVNDGSFYNLELANDQGIVWLNGTGNVADVRNSVDFNGPGAATVNRIVTHDPLAIPANGSGYSAVFGVMNPTAGLANMLDNTVNTNGNMSGIDNGYVQGRLRRAIAAGGGVYGYVLGLEPAGAGAQRGMQYIHLDFAGANNYDVIEGYFQTGLDNSFPTQLECSGYQIDYWGGTDHGQWIFNDFTGGGTGDYTVRVWPQDDNFPVKTVWLVTKDNSVQGTADDCGPTPVGLDRAGFNGFSQFGVAAADILLGNQIIDLRATAMNNSFIRVDWSTPEEEDLSHFEIERSLDNMNFEYLMTTTAAGNSLVQTNYFEDDHAVLPNQDYYYRIKMVNVDGSYNYSNVVTERINAENAGEGVVVYPNPISVGNATVAVTSVRERDLNVRVFDAIGQLIYTQQQVVPAGTSQFEIPSDNWPSGVYFIQLGDQDFNSVKELVKK